MKKRITSKFNSRQYMLSEDYEVFYYSDLHFHSVNLHTHDYYELYFFEEGSVEMEIGGDSYPLRHGDIILIPPEVEHRAVLTDPDMAYKRFVFWQSRNFARMMAEQSVEFKYMIAKTERERKYVYHADALTFNALRSKLFSLLDELSTDRYGKHTQVNIYIADLLLTLNRYVYEQDRSIGIKENSGRYEEITRYIDLHLDEELSLDRLAREFYLSKYYLVHLFQDRTGLSVHQYILKKRLEACCGSMLSGGSVGEAYRLWGFGDYSAFYRAFRKEYGMSPSAFLELYRSQR